MLILPNLIIHGIIFAFITTTSMLMVMMKVSPRVWAFSDYPKEITNNVPPQTKEEKHKIITLSIPFFILVIGYPFLSTFLAKQLYTGAMPLIDAFTNTLEF